ncbi:uncharacterized protein E5676_scaffold2198G00010 [Cucumis melo var. makuwa]|uniref:Uncharacterized protein n=1 Tax=Cucumis melo var. makuwa TaxID=1194695 RepID=A0A5D3DB14_CUCMM|nr:uncharacterized protein E5676_scaffold2198G00010 [Cucumis melo var. makuwa]
MKTIAVEKQSRVDIVFNEYGQPIGDESVGLASFLGPLVREFVPMNLENWLKLPTRLKVVLWKSIQLKSEKYKAMKKKQLPQTCSRKGYARLAEEMRKSSSDPSSVTRVALWTKAHKRKDGQPMNSQVAETLHCRSDGVIVKVVWKCSDDVMI